MVGDVGGVLVVRVRRGGSGVLQLFDGYILICYHISTGLIVKSDQATTKIMTKTQAIGWLKNNAHEGRDGFRDVYTLTRTDDDVAMAVAEWRCSQGNIYRVQEVLYRFDKSTVKEVSVRAAKTLLDLLREGRIEYVVNNHGVDELISETDKVHSRGNTQLNSRPEMVIETLTNAGIEISTDDYRLLAVAAERQYFADLNSAESGINCDEEFRLQEVAEVNRLRKLAGMEPTTLLSRATYSSRNPRDRGRSGGGFG